MNEHDEVIKRITETQNTKFNVLANSSTEKKHTIQGLFPDVILMSKDADKVAFIIEVETAESFNSSFFQWKMYSNLPYTFYVVVPTALLSQAKAMASISGLKIKFGHYTKNGSDITIQYE